MAEAPTPCALTLASPGNLWSISALATEFSLDRRTVRKRLEGVRPVGDWRGHPTYRLRDVAGPLLGLAARVQTDDELGLPADPFQRRAAVQAMRELDELKARRGQLLERDAVELEMARLVRFFGRALEELPDLLEAEAGLAPHQVEVLHEQLLRRGNLLAARLASREDLPDHE